MSQQSLFDSTLPVTLRGTLERVVFHNEDTGWTVLRMKVQGKADPVAVEQIVHNLLMNALHALELVPADARRIRLWLGAEQGQGVLRVTDSGPGIAADVLPRLFQPFFSTRPGGMGLGLSLCETLATGMGGALTAANAEPRGAVFTLQLPLAAP